MRTSVLVALASLFVAGCNRPSPEHAAAPAPAAAPTTPLAQTPPLIPGMGNHHHAIVTTSSEAQQYFDQGFNYVFGFNHEEAVRSFRRAAELDPKAAMPHWGIAWALGPNYNLDIDDPRAKQASQEMQVAQKLAAAAPPEERAYVAAMAVR